MNFRKTAGPKKKLTTKVFLTYYQLLVLHVIDNKPTIIFYRNSIDNVVLILKKKDLTKKQKILHTKELMPSTSISILYEVLEQRPPKLVEGGICLQKFKSS